MRSRCAVGFSGYREAGRESLGQILHDGPVTTHNRVQIILRHLYAIIRVGYVYKTNEVFQKQTGITYITF